MEKADIIGPVPAKTFEAWKLKKQHGDIAAIGKATGLPRAVIAKALNGAASPALVKKINEFYKL